MRLILDALMWLLQLATFVIIIQVVMSWLVSFKVLSIQNPMVRQIWTTLEQITEPVYRPLRNILPPMGGLDLTPMVAFFGIYILQMAIVRYGYPLAPF